MRKAGSKLEPTAERFAMMKVGCSSYDKSRCGWTSRFELTTGGWVCVGYKEHEGADAKGNGHNHDLQQSRTEVMAARSGEFIPEDLMDLAEKMALGGSNGSIIHATLKANAAAMQVPVTWSRDTVYDWYVRTRTSCGFDLSELLEMLKKRQQDTGYCFKTKLEDTGCSNDFVLHGVLRIASCCLLPLCPVTHRRTIHRPPPPPPPSCSCQ